MVTTMSAPEAQEQFGDLIGRVSKASDAIVVERDGEPVAVLISPDEFARYRQWAERQQAEWWASIVRVQEKNADRDPDDVLREAPELVEEAPRERRAQRHADARRPWRQRPVEHLPLMPSV